MKLANEVQFTMSDSYYKLDLRYRNAFSVQFVLLNEPY